MFKKGDFVNVLWPQDEQFSSESDLQGIILEDEDPNNDWIDVWTVNVFGEYIEIRQPKKLLKKIIS